MQSARLFILLSFEFTLTTKVVFIEEICHTNLPECYSRSFEMRWTIATSVCFESTLNIAVALGDYFSTQVLVTVKYILFEEYWVHEFQSKLILHLSCRAKKIFIRAADLVNLYNKCSEM